MAPDVLAYERVPIPAEDPVAEVTRAYRALFIEVVNASHDAKALRVPLGPRRPNAIRTTLRKYARAHGLGLHTQLGEDRAHLLIWVTAPAGG